MCDSHHHDHEQDHVHETRDHDGGHVHHLHDHGHHHSHSAAGQGADRDQKILLYMIAHNAEHAQEMRDLAKRLREAGKQEAADLIAEASDGFDHANAGLQKAVELLG